MPWLFWQVHDKVDKGTLITYTLLIKSKYW